MHIRNLEGSLNEPFQRESGLSQQMKLLENGLNFSLFM